MASELAKRLAARIGESVLCDMACGYRTDDVEPLIDAELAGVRKALDMHCMRNYTYADAHRVHECQNCETTWKDSDMAHTPDCILSQLEPNP